MGISGPPRAVVHTVVQNVPVDGESTDLISLVLLMQTTVWVPVTGIELTSWLLRSEARGAAPGHHYLRVSLCFASDLVCGKARRSTFWTLPPSNSLLSSHCYHESAAQNRNAQLIRGLTLTLKSVQFPMSGHADIVG